MISGDSVGLSFTVASTDFGDAVKPVTRRPIVLRLPGLFRSQNHAITR